MHNHFSTYSSLTSIHLCHHLISSSNSSWPLWPCLVTHSCFPHCVLLKLLFPASDCAYINTFIPIHCLHMAMNVDGRNFVCSQELKNATLFEPHFVITFHFYWHWTGVMDSCGFKVTCVGGEMSCDCVELVLSSFITLINNVTQEAKFFSPSC